MGLFDIILKGIGFEDEDPNAPSETVERKPKKQKPNEGAKFDLTKEPIEESITIPKQDPIKPVEISIPTNIGPVSPAKSGMVQSPRSQSDIQDIVELLRKREPVIVNFSAFSGRDAERGLDFLSGAVYAMRGKVEKLDGNLFLLTPQPK